MVFKQLISQASKANLPLFGNFREPRGHPLIARHFDTEPSLPCLPLLASSFLSRSVIKSF